MGQGILILQRGADASDNGTVGYSGYNLKYGSKTLAEIIEAGFIPLSIKVTKDYAQMTGLGSRLIAINTSEDTGFRAYTGATAITEVSNYYFDLESHYGGDLAKCKAVRTFEQVKVNGTMHDNTLTFHVCKWLEPIN